MSKPLYHVGYAGSEATGLAFNASLKGKSLKFNTLAEAEAAIAAIAHFDPAEVYRGHYYIDAPGEDFDCGLSV